METLKHFQQLSQSPFSTHHEAQMMAEQVKSLRHRLMELTGFDDDVEIVVVEENNSKQKLKNLLGGI